MLDPVTGLGLFVNAVQVAEYASKIIKRSSQLRSLGSITAVKGSQSIVEGLRTCCQHIENGIESSSGGKSLSVEDQALQETSRKIRAIALELLQSLEDLTPESSPGRRDSIKLAFKSTISSNRRKELKAELEELRNLLVIQNLAALRRSVGQLENKKDTKHDSQSQEPQKSVFDTTDVNGPIHRLLKEQVDGDIEYKKAEIASIVEEIIPLINRASPFLTAASEEADRDRRAKYSIIESLYFRSISQREDAIDTAHEKTFRWVLREDQGPTDKWTNFMHWLRTGSGSYWVAGKPASGKSTLMKFLYLHPETLKAAQGWAGPNRLIFASFYFWNLGTIEQKSQAGLLKTLLRTILTQIPDMIPDVFNEEYKLLTSTTQLSRQRLIHNSGSLREAFTRMMINLPSDVRLCLFIDGLDEYEGDEGDKGELLRLLRDLATPQVKMTLASRTENVYRAAFKNHPQLWLEMLTKGDIKAYVTTYITNYRKDHNEEDDLSLESSVALQALIEEIVTKASGVFLWVVLVVKSLIRGLLRYDDIQELRKKLDETPHELNELYDHMMKRMHPADQVTGSKYLQIVLRSTEVQQHHPLSPPGLWYAYEATKGAGQIGIYRQGKDRAYGEHPEIEARLTSFCCGLAEIQAETKWVTFIHKSVADFLRQPSVSKDMTKLFMENDIAFDPNPFLARASLLLLENGAMPVGKQLNDNWAVELINYFLEYLRGFEKSSQKTQPKLLAELRELIYKKDLVSGRMLEGASLGGGYFAVDSSGCKSTMPRIDLSSLAPQTADLAIAATNGLVLHVRELFGAVGKSSSPPPPPPPLPPENRVLSLLLHPYTTYRAFYADYLLQVEEILAILLERGNDPNSVLLFGQSAWSNAVSAMLLSSGDIGKDGHDFQFSQLRMATLLVAHGASDVVTIRELKAADDSKPLKRPAIECIASLKYESYYNESREEFNIGLDRFTKAKRVLIEQMESRKRATSRRRQRSKLVNWFSKK